MRAPLLVLICAYAVSIAGLTLIPSTDPQGQPWTMSFFHAFYFVSYMGSTIGFGEIPYPFNDAQRLWVTAAMYICVIAWLYAIGSILALVQETAFRKIVAEQRFTDRVKRMAEPFYLICGYGETGNLLVSALSQQSRHSVVIDHDDQRINQIVLESRGLDVPALNADAREVHYLTVAGMKHPHCRAVLALTSNEDINVKVALTSKLLRPELPVICRANTKSTAANLASFNTEHIINPFQVFAEYLSLALRSPSVHLLYSWLAKTPGEQLPKPVKPPRGTWIICGFGRFGQEVHRYLSYEGVKTVIIEPDPECAPQNAIIGRGTEAVTLREAGIDKAVGLVAGADLDINNLSIVITARELNPELYVVARQNRRANDEVFQATKPDLIMETSRILVMRILPLLTTPLLSRFLLQVRHHNAEWAEQVLDRLRPFCDRYTPRTWHVALGQNDTPALHAVMLSGRPVRLAELLHKTAADGGSDSVDSGEQTLDFVVLMLRRGDQDILLPGPEQQLMIDDQLLFCGERSAATQIEWRLRDPNVLDSQLTGRQHHDGWLWGWLVRRGWLSE